MLTINGWTVLAHPLFLDQWEKQIATVDALKATKPDEYQKSADAKLLAGLVQLVEEHSARPDSCDLSPMLNSWR
jgi:toxin YhaV